jgi:uncharacterized protein (DUF1015 family)
MASAEPLAEIAPLRGVLYDPAKAGPLERVLAPPYDVISPAEREALAALSPYGIVHLILPAGEGNEKYAAAARRYGEWRAAGILQRDERPAIYRYQQTFASRGRTLTRKGFICGLRLRRFEERVVLPHERTMSAPKADRLALSRACRAYFSQVFGLYSDPAGEAEAAFEPLAGRPPELEATTGDGISHQLWRLTDPADQRRVADVLRQRRVYIADGHHRYETMLALRDELRAESTGPRSTIEYGSFYLCRMEDPGLEVLATHRVVHSLPSFDLPRFLQAAGAFFTAEENAAEDVEAELARRGAAAPTLGLVHGGRLFFLSLKPGVERRLDVSLLHDLLLERVLGIDRAAQQKQTNLRYVKDTAQALREARQPGVQAVFLLNPTPLADLRARADAGEVLPQKSTYFVPKLASGLVIDPLDPREELAG